MPADPRGLDAVITNMRPLNGWTREAKAGYWAAISERGTGVEGGW